MAENELKAIMKLRYDTYTNWATSNPVLRAGETAYVLIESESADVQSIVLTKVGNGTDAFNNLPWISANSADVYEWAKQENKPEYTASEVSGLDTELDKKVDKTSEQYKIYGTDASGTQTNLTYNSAVANSAIVQRNASGQILVPTTPSGTSSAVSKSYVDSYFIKNGGKIYAQQLDWASRAQTNAVNPMYALAFDVIGGNCFELCNPAGITVEYSTDGGSTWTDYGLTNTQKIAFLSSGATTTDGSSPVLYIGKKTASKATVNDKLRITIDADACGVYTVIKDILIYCSTAGASGCSVAYTATHDDTTWTTLAGGGEIAGWPGWNSRPTRESWFSFGGDGSLSTNWTQLRMTFSITGVSSNFNSNLSINKILLLSNVKYYGSSAGLKGNVYSYDTSGNTTFPAQVSATKFVGDGSGLTNLPSGMSMKEYTANLSLDSWASDTSTGGYKLTVSASGIKASYTISPQVDLITGDISAPNARALLTDWAKVYKCETKANQVMFYADEKPSNSLTVKIKVVE